MTATDILHALALAGSAEATATLIEQTMKTTKQISFKITREESAIISKIVDRAAKVAQRIGASFDYMSCNMDITACHANGMPLDLQLLLDAPEMDFVHDVCGIRDHINRETGEIEDFFVPRFAKR